MPYDMEHQDKWTSIIETTLTVACGVDFPTVSKEQPSTPSCGKPWGAVAVL